jgi:hypothetical protein
MSTVSKEKMIKLNFSALKYEKSSDKAHSFSTGKYKGKYKGAIASVLVSTKESIKGLFIYRSRSVRTSFGCM